MVSKRQDIIEKNLEYAHTQVERFVFKYYRMDFKGKLFANKGLKKERRYSKITFNQDGSADIDLEYNMMLNDPEDTNEKDKKGLILRSALREAVRYGLAKTGREPDGKTYEQELVRVGLPSYNNLPEMGLWLHTYVCWNCGRIQMLTIKKLPPKKDPSKNIHVKTACCNANFNYNGAILYNNKQLVQLRQFITVGGDN